MQKCFLCDTGVQLILQLYQVQDTLDLHPSLHNHTHTHLQSFFIFKYCSPVLPHADQKGSHDSREEGKDSTESEDW